jgi:hypothetical protein
MYSWYFIKSMVIMVYFIYKKTCPYTLHVAKSCRPLLFKYLIGKNIVHVNWNSMLNSLTMINTHLVRFSDEIFIESIEILTIFPCFSMSLVKEIYKSIYTIYNFNSRDVEILAWSNKLFRELIGRLFHMILLWKDDIVKYLI